MGDKSKIEWTEMTWNPLRGCTKVSAGCQNCYAERMAARYSGPGGPYEGLVKRGKWNGKVFMIDDHLEDPLKKRRPRRIFVNSMSDLFHKAVPDRWIANIWDVMERADWHTYQVLTKRPERMAKWLSGKTVPDHIWVGASVEDQKSTDERIPHLVDIDAKVRWISVEPMLGPVDISRWAMRSLRPIRWVVAGCESGPGARPCSHGWIAKLRDQCNVSGTRFFLKQLNVGGKLVKMPAFEGKVHNEYPHVLTRGHMA